MRRKFNVTAKTANANDEETEMLQSELQDGGVMRNGGRWGLRERADAVDEHARAALGVVDDRGTDERAESDVKEADEMLG